MWEFGQLASNKKVALRNVFGVNMTGVSSMNWDSV